MMTFFTWGSQDGSGIAKEHFGISLKGRTTAILNARNAFTQVPFTNSCAYPFSAPSSFPTSNYLKSFF